MIQHEENPIEITMLNFYTNELRKPILSESGMITVFTPTKKYEGNYQVRNTLNNDKFNGTYILSISYNRCILELKYSDYKIPINDYVKKGTLDRRSEEFHIVINELKHSPAYSK